VRSKFSLLQTGLDERQRRLWAAAEARVLGRGGIACVTEATGLSRTTVRAGMKELQAGPDARDRVRRAGGGRKPLTFHDPALPKALEALVEPATRGDPMSPLRWTCKSVAKLAAELGRQGRPVSPRTVYGMLVEAGYSLQSNRKTKEGGVHPDRNAQFEHISAQVKSFQRRAQPVISVDTKKKELVGDFKNGGREWHLKGKPPPVRVHDFIDKDLGKAIPYGVYDLGSNQGWVSVGTNHDTADFAVESVRRWWRTMGRRVYPDAQELLITADGGGSNGYRVRAWKVALQRLANDTGLGISVCHFPPGTSKWNKIEHRMFCHITQNWRGRPLVTLDTVVSLIGNTTTRTGLRIKAKLDTNVYQKGVKVTDQELAQVRIKPSSFHGEWNYKISPDLR